MEGSENSVTSAHGFSPEFNHAGALAPVEEGQNQVHPGRRPEFVTTRAVVARVNRKLAHERGALRKSRPGSRLFDNLGDWYRLDHTNAVVDWHIDLERFARDLGVLAPGEQIESNTESAGGEK